VNMGNSLMDVRASVLGSWLEPQVSRMSAKRAIEHDESAAGHSSHALFTSFHLSNPQAYSEDVPTPMALLNRSIFLSKGNELILEALLLGWLRPGTGV